MLLKGETDTRLKAPRAQQGQWGNLFPWSDLRDLVELLGSPPALFCELLFLLLSLLLLLFFLLLIVLR